MPEIIKDHSDNEDRKNRILHRSAKKLSALVAEKLERGMVVESVPFHRYDVPLSGKLRELGDQGNVYIYGNSEEDFIIAIEGSEGSFVYFLEANYPTNSRLNLYGKFIPGSDLAELARLESVVNDDEELVALKEHVERLGLGSINSRENGYFQAFDLLIQELADLESTGQVD